MFSYQQFRKDLQRGRRVRLPLPGEITLPEVPEDGLLEVDFIANEFSNLWQRQKNLCINVAFQMALEAWRDIVDRMEDLDLLLEPRFREGIDLTNEAIGMMQAGYEVHQSWQNVGQRERPWDAIFEDAIDVMQEIGYTPDSMSMSLYEDQTLESQRERLTLGWAWFNLLDGMKYWARTQLTSSSRMYSWGGDRMEYEHTLLPFINVYILRDLTDISLSERSTFLRAGRVFVLNQWWAECLRHMPIQQGPRAEIEYFNF